MATKKKRLVRSRTNRVIGGVLGGIADYFGWNATLLRWIYVILTLAIPGVRIVLGLLIYVALMTFIPLDDSQSAASPFSGLFGNFGGRQASQDQGRKEIHDVTERDVHHKDGD